jgi:hypothetical protein
VAFFLNRFLTSSALIPPPSSSFLRVLSSPFFSLHHVHHLSDYTIVVGSKPVGVGADRVRSVSHTR